MCFGGRSSAPAAPEPVAPAPPPVVRVSQTGPAPAGSSESSGQTYSEGSNVLVKKKGKQILTIPLIAASGSGLQIQN